MTTEEGAEKGHLRKALQALAGFEDRERGPWAKDAGKGKEAHSLLEASELNSILPTT